MKKLLVLLISILMSVALLTPISADGEDSTIVSETPSSENVVSDEEFTEASDEKILGDSELDEQIETEEMNSDTLKVDESKKEANIVKKQDQESNNVLVDNEIVTESNDIDVQNALVTLTKRDMKIGDFGSISDAILEVEDYDYKTNKDTYTISLNSDIKEDVFIPANKKITIDLCGHEITNINDHTITNNSSMATITDSSDDSSGIVDNISDEKAAIYSTASLTLKGGNYTRSMENSTTDSDGGNSYNVIYSEAKITISNGAKVYFSKTNPGYYSDLVYCSDSLTLRDSELRGGKSTVNISDSSSNNYLYAGAKIIQNTEGNVCINANDNFKLYDDDTILVESTNGIAILVNYKKGGSVTFYGGTIKGRDGAVVFDSNDAWTKLPTMYLGQTKSDVRPVFEITKDDAENKLIEAIEGMTVRFNNAIFKGLNEDEKDRIINIEPTLPSSGDKDIVYKASLGGFTIDYPEGEEVVSVLDKNGDTHYYSTINQMIENLTSGSSITLLSDIKLTSTVVFKDVVDITIDLNGHSFDGNGLEETIKIQNTSNTASQTSESAYFNFINNGESVSNISGEIPIYVNSYSQPLKISICDNVDLKTESLNKLYLTGEAYMEYNDTNLALFKNGMYSAVNGGENRIYGSFSSAADFSEDKVATLLNDYEGTTVISGDGILDLNQKTFTHTGSSDMISVDISNGELWIMNGKLISNEGHGAFFLYSTNNPTNTTLVLENVEMTVSGEDKYGIVSNGQDIDNYLRLIDSTLSVPNGTGIYFPSTGSVTIENSVIDAKYVGIQMCAGDLTVKGNETSITASSTPIEKTGDGVIADGSAISIVKRDGYQELGNIVIEDGNFVSKNSESVKTYEFNSTDGEVEWKESNEKVKIQGGTYSDISPIKNLDVEADIDIKLEKDQILDEVLTIPQGTVVNLDTNGKNITPVEGNDSSDVVVNGTLNIKNTSSEEGSLSDLKIETSSDGVVVATGPNNPLANDNVVDNSNLIIGANIEFGSLDRIEEGEAIKLEISQDEKLELVNLVNNLANMSENELIAGLYMDASDAASFEKAKVSDLTLTVSVTSPLPDDNDVKRLDSALDDSRDTLLAYAQISLILNDANGDEVAVIRKLPEQNDIDVKITVSDPKTDGTYMAMSIHRSSDTDTTGSMVTNNGTLSGDIVTYSLDKFSTFVFIHRAPVSSSGNTKPDHSFRPSPSKDLPSNTKECVAEFGDAYVWSDEYDACVIKFMIVPTSAR